VDLIVTLAIKILSFSLFSDATSTADVSWHQITYEDNKKLQWVGKYYEEKQSWIILRYDPSTYKLRKIMINLIQTDMNPSKIQIRFLLNTRCVHDCYANTRHKYTADAICKSRPQHTHFDKWHLVTDHYRKQNKILPNHVGFKVQDTHLTKATSSPLLPPKDMMQFAAEVLSQTMSRPPEEMGYSSA
jgi:hypothetical protein